MARLCNFKAKTPTINDFDDMYIITNLGLPHI